MIFSGMPHHPQRAAFPVGSHLAENLVERIPGGDAETDGSDLDILVAAAGIKNVGQFNLGKSVILTVRQHHNDFPAGGVGRNFMTNSEISEGLKYGLVKIRTSSGFQIFHLTDEMFANL